MKSSGHMPSKGSNCQDFTSLEHYPTEKLRKMMLDAAVPEDLRLRELLDFAASLAMQDASEPSFAKVTTIFSFCTEGSDRARAISKETLSIMYKHVNKMFQELCLKGLVS